MKKVYKKILIVEDDQHLRRVLADNFEVEGFEVLQATDGAGALELALRQVPDIILLDILLPGGMDGLTVLKKLRESPQGAEMPVILLTNVEMDDKVLKEVAMYKPTYYLVKAEWNINKVIEMVKERVGLLKK